MVQKFLVQEVPYNSQWGPVCPIESRGGNVGIINHLSIMAKVTTNISECIKEALATKILFLEDLISNMIQLKYFKWEIKVFFRRPFLYKYLNY